MFTPAWPELIQRKELSSRTPKCVHEPMDLSHHPILCYVWRLDWKWVWPDLKQQPHGMPALTGRISSWAIMLPWNIISLFSLMFVFIGKVDIQNKGEKGWKVFCLLGYAPNSPYGWGWSNPKWGDRNQEPGAVSRSPKWAQGSKALSQNLLLSLSASKELDVKWSNSSTNRDPYEILAFARWRFSYWVLMSGKMRWVLCHTWKRSEFHQPWLTIWSTKHGPDSKIYTHSGTGSAFLIKSFNIWSFIENPLKETLARL